MVLYGGKMNTDTGPDLVASADLLVTRLSGEPIRSCINKKKDLLSTFKKMLNGFLQ